MWEPPAEHPLRRMFAGLAEHAFFSHLGVTDPPVIDYLSALLSRFVHSDAVYRLRGGHGQPLTALAEMVQEATALPSGGPTQREYFRHIGDFALFWTGVFPEALDRVRSRHCKDHLVDYTVQGKRGYLLASRVGEEKFPDESAVLRRLSQQFEICAIGLREVRREWEHLQTDGQVPPDAGHTR